MGSEMCIRDSVWMAQTSDRCLRISPSKSWGSWKEVLADHRVFTSNWFKMFDAYVGPNSLSPYLIEAAMLAVNSVNNCTF